MNPITESGHLTIGRPNHGRRRPKLADKSHKVNLHRAKTRFDRSQMPELENVCSEFASLFSYMLIKNMRSTIPKSNFLQEFHGKKMVNAMVDQKISQYLSSQNGFGLKELLLGKLAPDMINLKNKLDDNINVKNKSEVIKNPARKE